jgi:hypothetical protein
MVVEKSEPIFLRSLSKRSMDKVINEKVTFLKAKKILASPSKFAIKNL